VEGRGRQSSQVRIKKSKIHEKTTKKPHRKKRVRRVLRPVSRGTCGRISSSKKRGRELTTKK